LEGDEELEHLRNQSFPPMTITDWKKKAEQSLKGKSVESLQTATYENIILKPLYTRQDEKNTPDFPGGSDYRRGATPLGYVTNEWKVAQRITFETAVELMDKLRDAIEKGQTAISFDITNFEENESLIELLCELAEKYPFAINSKGHNLHDRLPKNITGYIAADPISLFSVAGGISETYLQEWAADIFQAASEFQNLKTVLIDTTPYHNGGANAVQELAIAIAEGVTYLDLLSDKGMDLKTAFSKMVFQFAIGGNFFMELAKLRAARILWDKVAKVYGVHGGAGMEIAAENSMFTKTIHDPHVNLLRAGNEAFAAVLGGTQYLHVEPFDAMTGSRAFSERIARNIQMILKDEVHLKRVIDPAGGSWYVEELTTQLAEKAWAFFQEIEVHGGILVALKSSWLQTEIAAVFEKRTKDIQTRKQSIVGTNVYAKLDESISSKKTLLGLDSVFEKEILIDAVPQHRLSEPFEELRARASRLKETPAVGMLCLGELKQYKARLDFMKGFLAAGGIHTVESGEIHSLEQAKKFIAEQQSKHFCICGTNEQYGDEGLELLTALTAEFPLKSFFLAGLPDNQDEWQAKGLKKFIHVKSNCYEELSQILTEMEAAADEA
jgi:methylmalonyl-CoA mutase